MSVTDREALLAAIIEAPDDDTPRLIFADWMDENGESERAEFIRLQIELSQWKHKRGLDKSAPAGLFGEQERRFLNDKGYKRAKRRERYLFDTNQFQWFTLPTHFECSLYEYHGGGGNPRPLAYVARGFVQSFRCSWTDFIEPAEHQTREHPLRKVWLTDWPTRFTDDDTQWHLRDDALWFMSAPLPDGSQVRFDRVQHDRLSPEELRRRHSTMLAGGVMNPEYIGPPPRPRNEWRCDKWPRVTFEMPLATYDDFAQITGQLVYQSVLDQYRDMAFGIRDAEPSAYNYASAVAASR